VKDVGTVSVNHYARSSVSLSMAIPADVTAFLDDRARQPRFRQFTGNDSATETSTDNRYPLHPGFLAPQTAPRQRLAGRLF